MSTSTSPDRLADARSVELVIGGMTCSPCAARIEKKLNKLDGVSVTGNDATERAKVTYSGSVTPEDLVATIEATGYTAALPAPQDRRGDRVGVRSSRRGQEGRQR
jgi:P-type Cu+ transporter